MRGYSSVILGLTASIFLFSSDIGRSQRVYLGSGFVKADRTSPAFSAFEDAFVLKDFAKEKAKAKKAPQQKISLRGLKVSSGRSLKKIILKGERVEVAHFTHKFIDKKNDKIILGKSLKLASIDTNWNEKIYVSSKIKVQNLKTPEISVAENKSLSAAEVERVELPSGIILTRPKSIDETEKPRILARVETRQSSVNHIAYGSSIKLKGEISFDGGDVAFDKGEYIYYLERKLDGHIFETGTASALSSEFEIEVADSKGILSVELRSLSGDILAYGEKVLSLSDKARKLALNLYPSEDLFSGRVLKDALSKKGVEIAEVSSVQKVSGVEGDLETDKQGYFNESIFEKGSSFVVETKAKNKWPELNIGVSGKPLYPRLLDKKALAKFSKDLDPFGEDIEIRSLLMGSVTQLGLFQREVSIRIYNQEHQRPVYFNSSRNIDHTLNATSSSGGFAFANLPSGGYLIQALRGEQLLAQKWFIVKEGHLSKGQIELNKKVTAVVSTEVFPARVKVKSPLVFEEMGVETGFELGQAVETQIELKSNPQLTVFKSKKDENFKQHIYVTSSKIMKKRFKLLSKEWLESFLNSRRSNANRALGMVVGFINDEDFEIVKQSSNSLSAQSQIFYFDKNGDFTDQGQEGGGFIITDVSPGVKTTVVSLNRKKTFLNKITIVKPYSISIF